MKGWADAPTLEADDVAAWNFYQRTATAFVRDFGLMDSRIREMKIKGVAREIFLEKLSAIHDAHIERHAGEGGKTKGEDIEGDENG